MKKNTLYNLLAATTALLLASCAQDHSTVKISGNINDAKGETLALMHLSGNNPVLVDTLTLGEDGSFKFTPKVEEGGPDFFCLVLNGQTIPVISDTLQTPIVVTSQKEHFGSSYEVKDSINNALKQAVNLGGDLRRNVLNITNLLNNRKMSQVMYNDSLQNLLSNYKEEVLKKYIYTDPASPISYYLLFETVSGLNLFTPYDAKDNRAFGAVANLWLYTYPNSPRTAFLKQITEEGIALRIQARKEQEKADSLIQNAVINTANFIDINLPGTNDQMVALSSICGHGNITLVDFTAYYVSEISVDHNERLSRIYNQYKDQGLKIYQVCLDSDLNFWKISASNVPWTVVRDPELLYDQNGLVQYSSAAALYNVSNIPTTFIMGRDGSPIKRIEDDSKLAAAVSQAM